ncbi:MAG: putative RNA-binding protein (virulence factor B family) [Cyclobacteriaceae bacterium]|jgi:predicted RNA-binding protein (virulence factor B family)
MLELGQYQTLELLRLTPPGAFLGNEAGSEVLLPNKYVPTNAAVGDKIHVFIYMDSEDRIVATTREPYVLKDEFACLKVIDVNNFGAFLDWGLEKDLLVPFKQQNSNMRVGQWYLIYLYHDEQSDRLVATAKVHPLFEKENIQLEEGQQVDLLVAEEVEIGMKVVINNKYQGMIYHNEIHQDLIIGDRLPGFVKQIREDNKIDISLQAIGIAHLEVGAEKILQILKENEGYLAITDKSDPEDIQFHFQLSKKAFKRSLGTLYKAKRVSLEPDGIKLINA